MSDLGARTSVAIDSAAPDNSKGILMTKAFYANTSMGAEFSHNPVVAIQARQLSLIPGRRDHPLRVLDLGCGAGTPTRLVMSDATKFHVTGTDISMHALTRYVAETHRSGVQLDAQRLPFTDGSFDVVVSDDVIEHLVDTDAYAKEIARVLVDDGWLFLSTPNLAAWFNRLGLLFGLQPAFTEVSFERVFGRPGADIVGHLRLFTSRSTREFLLHHGFTVVDHQGARFDGLPRALRFVDGLFARLPALAGNSVIVARRVSRRAKTAQ